MDVQQAVNDLISRAWWWILSAAFVGALAANIVFWGLQSLMRNVNKKGEWTQTEDGRWEWKDIP
jgi:hypothetical protein